MKPTTVLVLTHRDKITGRVLQPHVPWIIDAGLDVRIVIGKDSPLGKQDNWRNGDRPLRDWWLKNSHTVDSGVIAVLEWDTLVIGPLPDLPDTLDLGGAKMFIENPLIRGKWRRLTMADPKWTSDNWWWWPDIPLLDLIDDQTAVGLISFGAFFMRRWVLDAVCRPEWDNLYRKSIQNEIRFPTIVKCCGGRVGELDLPFVSHTDVKAGTKPGVYHSVDHPVAL
jgi:hypothetical protein